MNVYDVKTFTATIYCGFKPGYDGETPLNSMKMAEKICQTYCNENGMGLTIEPTRFIYKDGNEDGVKVGIINYPRFPKTPAQIKAIALDIAVKLKTAFEQHRVSVVCTDDTIMLGEK